MRRNLAPVFLGTWAAAFGVAATPQAKLMVVAPAVFGGVAWWTILSPGRWLVFFFFCALLLPPLPLPFGNAGVHIAPLFALLGLLAGILRITEWRVWPGSLPLLFVVFLAVLTGSTAFAALYSGWNIAGGSLARVLLFGISVYVFLYTFMGPRGRNSDPIAFARFLFWIGLLAALFACVDFYFQLPAPAGYGAQFVWLDQGVFRRAQGLFYEASTLGNFCAFFLVMILVASFGGVNERVCSRPVLVFGALAFSAALIFSYSRASLVNVLVAGCAFVYVRRLKIRRALVALFVSGAAAAIIVRFALPAFSSNYWSRIEASLQYLWTSPDGVLSGRVSNWKILSDFLYAQPWHALFGIGYKTIPYTDYIRSGLIADNTYLSLLVETGFAGLIAFLFLNAAILRSAFRAARSANTRAAFFGTWILCFWSGEMVQMFSGDLITYWRVLPLYFWVLATAARESQE